jgi:UDP-N-acetyl-D-mannosaminuronate dehydrogenase
MKQATKHTKRQKVGVLGYGEVGQAIAKFYKQPLIKDLNRNEFDGELDILHVCIPAIDNFFDIVSETITLHNPKLVIIHSTVIPGTTKKLNDKFGNVVHSPVRGVHPNLYEGIKAFVKYVGADDQAVGEEVVAHLKKIGIKKVKLLPSSIATEVAKLLDTTYYGLCISFHGYADKISKEVGVDFDQVMTDFNQTYNEGYAKLGRKHVVRPVLNAPADGKIGGHCVVPNAEILAKQFGDDEILRSIIRHK